MGDFQLKLDIVAPVYNEEKVIGIFLKELSSQLSLIRNKHPELDVRVILVDDGSTDGTVEQIINHPTNVQISLLRLSRNFGHQNAVWAGMESVRISSYCIVMDSDLQDPPKLISNILDAFLLKHPVVLMQRISRTDSKVKVIFAKLFYEIQHRMGSKNSTRNVGDFFGLAPIALAALLRHKEQVKYIRGLVGDLGFNRALIPYERMARAKGATHYTVPKMFSLAIAGITGFSIQPLIWVVYLALFGGVLGISLIGYVLYLRLAGNYMLAPGWAFSTISATFLSSLILIALAIISIYLARIIQELKGRPIYILDKENETSIEPRD